MPSPEQPADPAAELIAAAAAVASVGGADDDLLHWAAHIAPVLAGTGPPA